MVPFDEKAEIENMFTYHAPTPEQITKYQQIRDTAKAFALLLLDLCPESGERNMAIGCLDESVMHANASIARWDNKA